MLQQCVLSGCFSAGHKQWVTTFMHVIYYVYYLTLVHRLVGGSMSQQMIINVEYCEIEGNLKRTRYIILNTVKDNCINIIYNKWTTPIL